jgi:hypothetical protein
MPSILGSAELKFAQKSGSYASGTTQQLTLKVRETLLYRRLYVAVLPNNGVVTGYAWRAKVEFRLKDNPVEVWQLGWRNFTAPTVNTNTVPTNVEIPFITPPYWVETLSSDSADWPVTQTQLEEKTAILSMTDGTDIFLRRVHMLPMRLTGHFDEIALRIDQGYTTQVDGELNYLAVLGCLSQPLGD